MSDQTTYARGMERFEVDPTTVPTRTAETYEGPGIFDFDWEGFKAAASAPFYEGVGRYDQRRNDEMLHIAAQLARLNGKPFSTYTYVVPGEPGGIPPSANQEAIWTDLATYRATVDPNALKGVGTNAEDFTKEFDTRVRAEGNDREAAMAKQGIIPNLLGGALGSYADVPNLITAPIGMGTSLAKNIITRTVVNAGRSGMTNLATEIAITPFQALERERQGRAPMTEDEVLQNWGSAFVGGAGLDLLGAGASVAIKQGGKVIANTPAAQAAALRLAKPKWALTPEESAALHIVLREADIDASNPYVSRYDTLNTHAEKVEEFIRGWSMPPDAVPALAPIRPRARFAPDFDNAWNAIIGIEGGTDAAGRFRTSPAGAIGPAQVMPKTAPEAAKLAGLPWDEARYRSDPAYNIAIGQAYYREKLREFDGDPVKAAAAYNAGAGAVRKAVNKATKAGVPGDWVSFLPDPETRNYVAQFRRRTGMDGSAISAGGDVGATTDGEAMPARPAALDAERSPVAAPDALDDLETVPDGLPPELNPDNFPDTDSFRVAQSALDAERNGQAEPAVTWRGIMDERKEDLLPDLRRLVGQPSRDINDVDQLARDLGVQPELLREAMLELTRQGELTATRNGFYRGAEVAAKGSGYRPEDAFEFIARQGGIRDDEGHNLGLGQTAGDLRGLSKSAAAKARANRKFGSAALQTRTRKGMVLNRSGLTVDEMGELLHESGYLFGADGGRPTTREVIDFLTETKNSGKPAYSRDDQAAGFGREDEAAGPQSRDEAITFYRDYFADHAASTFGIDRWDVDDDILDAAAAYKYDLNLPDEDALMRAINDFASEADRAILDGDEGAFDYDDFDHDWPFDDPETGREDFADADFYRRYEPDTGLAGEGAEGLAPVGEGEGGARQLTPAEQDRAVAEGRIEAPQNPEAFTEFDDPGGEGVKATAASAWHDIRTELDEFQKQYVSPKTGEEAADLLWAENPTPEDRAAFAAGWEAGRHGGAIPDWNNEVEFEGWFVGQTTRELLGESERGTARAVEKAEAAKAEAASKTKEIPAAGQAAPERAAEPPEAGARQDVEPAAPEIIDRAAMAGKFTNAKGEFDAQAAAADISRQVGEALDQGGTAKLFLEDKEINIVRRDESGALFDDKGQRWGTMTIMFPGEGKSHFEISSGEPARLDLGEAVDPAIARRQMQEAQLRAEAPLRGENVTGAEQAGTMGLKLFDAYGQPLLDLDDGMGPRAVADLDAEMSAEESGIEAIRSCLL